jgi:hypothetical protein
VQECPQPPPGPTSHAGRAGTGAPTDRSRSLAIGRAVRGSRPDQCVDHCPCLPVFFSWLHFRQPRRQEPHVAAHSSDHRIGSGLRSQTPGSPPVRRSQTFAAAALRAVEQCRSSMAGSPGHQLADPDHQQWSPHHAQICAAGAERGIDPLPAQIGGSACFAQAEGRSHYVSGRGGSPGSRLWMPFDARACEARQARISRTCVGWRRSGKGSACARRADVQRGRRGSWTSSLDRVPQVSDAISCRDDIRVVPFSRLAAGMLDVSRCRLPP